MHFLTLFFDRYLHFYRVFAVCSAIYELWGVMSSTVSSIFGKAGSAARVRRTGVLVATALALTPALFADSAKAQSDIFVCTSVSPNTSCGHGHFTLMRSSRAQAHPATNGVVGAAALDNLYQWYGSFVTGFGFACHPYAGGQVLMPVVHNFSYGYMHIYGAHSWNGGPTC